MENLLLLFKMLVHIDQYLGSFIRDYGVWIYGILFCIIFAETGFVITPFLPGDSLLFIAGAFASSGQLDVTLLLLLLTIAAITGNSVNYAIGKAIGPKILERNYRFLDRQSLKKTHDFYEKHGGKTIILARFLPIVRTFAPFIAGVSSMTWKRFQCYNIVGALIWIFSLVIAGYLFGNLPIVKEYLNVIVLIGIGMAILPLVIGAIWKIFRKTKLTSY